MRPPHSMLCVVFVLATAACSKPNGPVASTNLAVTPSSVATAVTLSPQANASETDFVRAVAADLQRRFPTPADAQRGGYVRYTAEDQDGIITYTNLRWYQDDPRHPTQLWYDARGLLIGTDFTMPVRDRRHRPELWGMQPGRWVHFIAHVHYVVRDPSGGVRYGSMFNQRFRAAGGDPNYPTAEPLVRAGVARRASDVQLVFELPEIWIASFWVVPNPRGAFADSNPNVRPTQGEHQSAHPAQPTP